MSITRLHDITRPLAAVPSRRDVLRGLAATGLGLGFARRQELAEAKKKRKHTKKQKIKRNAFGCVNVGGYCKNSSQCCSGICEGKKGKRKCAAHNAGICIPSFDLCTTGVGHRCSATNPNCGCLLTTGNAGFCHDAVIGSVDCRDCSRDTDCQAEFGPGAACVDFGGLCSGYCPDTGGTACFRPCA